MTYKEKRNHLETRDKIDPRTLPVHRDDWEMVVILILSAIGGFTTLFGLIWLVLRMTYGF